MREFFFTCWQITLELAPWLLLGALAGGLLHVLLPTGWLNRQLRGPGGVVKSVLLGVPLPLCSCGVIPVGLSLRKAGASSGASVGFLISTPQTGVDSILVSANMLGWPFALFKVVAAAITGVVGGWIADVADKPSNMLPVLAPEEAPPERSLREVLAYADMLLRSLWRWLVIGVGVSALITVLAPGETLSGLGAYGGLAAMFVTLLISLPLYVCATASAPIAASLVAAGLPAGAALVFLMAGPATNLATIGAVREALGNRALVVYLAVIILGSMAAGLLFDAVVPAQQVVEAMHHQHNGWVAITSAAVLLLLLGRYALQDAAGCFSGKPVDDQDAISVNVDGMTCDGCVAKLTSALRSSNKVRQANVTLTPGRATVVGALTLDELRELVRKAGYKPTT
ncbi:MAG: permease [Planctomycetales bacterium]|nr:permease [Planctomycetales bacterium]